MNVVDILYEDHLTACPYSKIRRNSHVSAWIAGEKKKKKNLDALLCNLL